MHGDAMEGDEMKRAGDAMRCDVHDARRCADLTFRFAESGPGASYLVVDCSA